MAGFKDAEVYTLEGKKVGRIRNLDSSHFTAYRHGITIDEEYKIPVSAISAVEKDGSSTVIRLNMSEEQLTHGFEFSRGRPNSEFTSRAAGLEPKVPKDRQLIHYESQPRGDEGIATAKLPPASEYLCDMCNARFDDPSELQEHRAEQHKAPAGV